MAIRFSGGGPGASNGGARGFGAAAGAGSVVASEGSDFLGEFLEAFAPNALNYLYSRVFFD